MRIEKIIRNTLLWSTARKEAHNRVGIAAGETRLAGFLLDRAVSNDMGRLARINME